MIDLELGKNDDGTCTYCGKKVDMKDFRDELSVKEYEISGLCQSCQDLFFGTD